MLRFTQTQLLILGLALAGLLAGCATPTPLPGEFETALAGTVSVGSTAIAQSFSAQHATLTAGAPTATSTPPPSPTTPPTATGTNTPVATTTPAPSATAGVTAAPSPTRAATTAARATRPPAPTATPAAAAGPLLPGTYVQSGVCTTSNPPIADVRLWPGQPNPVLFTICASSVVVRASGEIQINVSWHSAQAPGGPDWSGRQAQLPGYNGSTLYLQDDLGQRYERIALDGAPRDGASGPLGSIFSGYYVFPAPQSGATIFTLVDGRQAFTLSNISLKVAST